MYGEGHTWNLAPRPTAGWCHPCSLNGMILGCCTSILEVSWRTSVICEHFPRHLAIADRLHVNCAHTTALKHWLSQKRIYDSFRQVTAPRIGLRLNSALLLSDCLPPLASKSSNSALQILVCRHFQHSRALRLLVQGRWNLARIS